MANAKAAALKELSDAELFERIDTAKKESFNLRFQHVTGQLENTSRLKEVRRDIARLLTELREREIAAAEALENQES
jgi:large subunit ribosomal protein L29